MTDYGYGDGAPDSDKYGYGDAAPDSAAAADKYGYGDGAPDSEDVAKYGYGDASPDDAAKYGYGDAAPDDAAKYGYGDAAPDDAAKYGYGDTAPDDAAKYGYGDASPDDAAKYGYGDTESPEIYQTGYNDEDGGDDDDDNHGTNGHHRRKPRRVRRTKSDDHQSFNNTNDGYISSGSNHSAQTAESYGSYESTMDLNGEQPRRQRYRRRGSVTKYSIETATTVQQEYENHEAIVNQYRAGGSSTGDDMQPSSYDRYDPSNNNNSTMNESNSEFGDHLDLATSDHKKKGTGKKILKGLKSLSRRRFSVDY